MERDLLVLASALESGCLPFADIVAWADRQVLDLESPPTWLLDLCLARTKEEAFGALYQAHYRCEELAGSFGPVTLDSHGLYLGILYVRHEQGELSLAELLRMAGDYADANIDIPSCESFYYLLNEIDGGGPTIPSDRPLKERVAELFAPMVRQHGDFKSSVISQPRADRQPALETSHVRRL
jgi:hypothetical protein